MSKMDDWWWRILMERNQPQPAPRQEWLDLMYRANTPWDKAGHPDTGRPMLHNPDGSISTEETTTIQDADGSWLNLPTIVGGTRVPEENAIEAMRRGQSTSTGRYNSLIEALTGAEYRTRELGKKLK